MAITVAPSGGLWAKGREPQIILKTDERDLVLELGARRKFVVKSSSWEKNRVFVEDDKPRGRGQERPLGDDPSARRPPPEPPPVEHYFPME